MASVFDEVVGSGKARRQGGLRGAIGESFIGDFFRSGFLNALPGFAWQAAPVAFDLLGFNDTTRQRLIEEAGQPTSSEAQILKTLSDVQNINANTRVQNRNREIQQQAEQQALRQQQLSQDLLRDEFAGSGLIDSGAFQRAVGESGRESQRGLQQLSAQLGSEAEDRRSQIEQQQIQAAIDAANVRARGEQRAALTGEELEAEREAALQQLAGTANFILQLAGMLGGGGAVPGQPAAPGQGGTSAQELLRLQQTASGSPGPARARQPQSAPVTAFSDSGRLDIDSILMKARAGMTLTPIETQALIDFLFGSGRR